jgi:GT2 family glycosyltransferase
MSDRHADFGPPAPRVSLVVATYNRLDRLRRCCEHVTANVGVDHELVLVDGGSTDGTRGWLTENARPNWRVILEDGREGATRAFNKGFRAARGEYVMWLNDDAYPLPGAVGAALSAIERPELADVGMIAFYHNHRPVWNRLDSVERDGVTYSVYNVRGVPYANFGLLRRALLARLGYLDEGYYFAAWDPDLSLKVQREAGLKVLGCRAALVYHDELHDERKREDLDAMQRDNERLFAKWALPPKNSYSDPAPAYRALLAERGLL